LPHPENHGPVSDCPTEKTDTSNKHKPSQSTQEVTPAHDHRWGLSTATSGDSNMALDSR